VLVWSDEFNQPDDSAPDPAKWGFDLGGGGWGNNELQAYTDRGTNARVEGGKLVLEARQETFTDTNKDTHDFTSARLTTKNKGRGPSVGWKRG
jgi:hypothetical protein